MLRIIVNFPLNKSKVCFKKKPVENQQFKDHESTNGLEEFIAFCVSQASITNDAPT